MDDLRKIWFSDIRGPGFPIISFTVLAKDNGVLGSMLGSHFFRGATGYCRETCDLGAWMDMTSTIRFW